MKQFLFLLLVLILSNSVAQENPKFNLGFENNGTDKSLSNGWFKWGNYELSLDSQAYLGEKSAKITSDQTGSSFGSVAYKIPAMYSGKSIRLTGYMKTNNVEEGFAGLLLRINGESDVLEFDNMQDQNITGTRDWQQYEINLNYPEEARTIYVAGIIVGKGEAWFDDFVISIDGEDIETLKEVKIELSNAEQDKEFDFASKIEIPELTSEKVIDLDLLGRVWGFLKYHHPAIAKGNYNWDYELLRFLPTYLEVSDLAKRDELLIRWIDGLGALEECSTCKPPSDDAFLKPDLVWISQQNAKLKEKLNEVYKSRTQGKHYYIDMHEGVGNPKFKHENSYANMPYPDDGFRLLSLYRYWNIIQYYFPYKHLMDSDWNLTMGAYIPTFIDAENELEYELAVLKIIAEIKDTHANLWNGSDKIREAIGVNFPAVHLSFIEDKLVVTDYFNAELKGKVGLEIGDVITKINEKSVESLVKDKEAYYPASNQPTRLRNMAADLLRSNSREIDITYSSKNLKDLHKTIPLYSKDSLDLYRGYRRTNEKSYKMLDGNIGYVTLASIKSTDISKIKKDFKDANGIIIDIRNYPADFVPFTLGSFFVSSKTPFVKFTNCSIENPGEFTFTDNIEIEPTDDIYQGKLVVLVNEVSQSQAEYTSMAFRAGDNTTIIGSTTAGADGNISTVLLPGGLSSIISGIGVHYPNGDETQRIGIVPDIEVKPTIEGIRLGKDELLEKAIEIIKVK